jgi:hypothetical protein
MVIDMAAAADVLSREHDNLRSLFAQLADPGADRGRIWSEIVKQAATHVAVERTFVYPLVRSGRVGPPGLAEELRREYKRMEHLLVLTERRKLNSPDMPDLVAELEDEFDRHKDRCATLLVPAMQAQLGPEEQEELAAKMAGAQNVIVSHPHPHLLATGPLYRFTTRVASRWDRLRDRTVRNR